MRSTFIPCGVLGWFAISITGCSSESEQLADAMEMTTPDSAALTDGGTDGGDVRPIVMISSAQLRAFGDSITFGYSTTTSSGRYDSTERWPERVGAALGFGPDNVDNRGINAATSSTIWTDEILPLWSAPSPAASVDMIFAGTNDARCHGASTVGRSGFREALRAEIALLLVHPAFTRADDPAITYTGAWSTFEPLKNRYTVEVGATAAFSVSGPEVWIGTYGLCAEHTEAGSVISVVVDGVNRATVGTDGVCSSACPSSGVAFPGQTFTPMVVRLRGLAPGPHAVQMVNLNAGYAYLSWYAVPQPQAATHVFVGNLLLNTPAGFAAFPPYYNHSSAAVVDLYNQEVAEVVGEFATDGFSVHLVDLNGDFVGNLGSEGTDPLMQSDELHPNARGLAIIAESFRQRILATLDLR